VAIFIDRGRHSLPAQSQAADQGTENPENSPTLMHVKCEAALAIRLAKKREKLA
jgi:hypothetical protein